MKMLLTINPEIEQMKYVVIYGAGGAGLKLFQHLLNYDIHVDYFCDSDPEKQGLTILGRKVLSPEKLFEFRNETAVLIGSTYYREIYGQLAEKGFSNVYIYNKYLFDSDAIVLD